MQKEKAENTEASNAKKEIKKTQVIPFRVYAIVRNRKYSGKQQLQDSL
jgi:hypothetical protein